MNKLKLIRYCFGLVMLGLMIGVSGYFKEKEIIFPEIAALILGLWIVEKRIWTISRSMVVILMTASAVFGVLLVLYSPYNLLINIAISFSFTSFCLYATGTNLIPIISASMLPVLLGTHSWVYPLSVFSMSLLLVSVQWILEKLGLRKIINSCSTKTPHKHSISHWIKLLMGLIIIALIPVYSHRLYIIVPPLVVTFVEFSSSSAGFRNRPVHIFFILIVSSIMGSLFQYILHYEIGLSEITTVLLLFICHFLFIEAIGKPFAPACAIALIPMIIPQQDILLYPLQVAAGSFIFLSAAMIFFLKCYRWKRAHLLVCFVPKFIRTRTSNTSK